MARLTLVLLVLLVAISCAPVTAPTRADPEDAARDQRRLEQVQQESAQLERTNRRRSFRFRVVDPDGNGVAGIPLFVSGLIYRSAVSLFMPMQEQFEQVVTSGADGYVECGPLTFGTLEVSVREHGLPDQYDSELHEQFHLPGDHQFQRADGRPRSAPGVDFIFYLHRYQGPRPLWALGGEIQHLPLDARPVPWRLSHPLYGYMDAEESVPADAEGVTPDFEVRFWRDPAVPVLEDDTAERIGGGPPTYRDGTPAKKWVREANHWIEIACVNGGLNPVEPFDGNPRVVREAPVDGYRQRVSWSYDFNAPDRDAGRWPGVQRRFWWRKSTNPPSYALVAFKVEAGISSSTKRGSIDVSSRLLINPIPGDRWIERPIRRHPQWITTPRRDDVLAWLARIGPVVPMPVQEVPPLKPGWPPGF